VAGAGTLTLALVATLLAALEGGHAIGWGSWQMALLLAAAATLFAVFGVVERRAADPVIPFRAFRERVVAVSSAGNLLMGVCMFGLTSYVPLFVQGVRGEPATSASAVLTPLFLGWSGCALLSGRFYVWAGFRTAALAGTLVIVLGVAPLLALTAHTPLVLVSVVMGLTGIGFGVTSSTFLLGPQSAVPWSLRGAVTSSTQFFRSIGGSVGVALMGALLNARLAAALPAETLTAAGSTSAAGAARDANSLISALLSAAGRAALPAEVVRGLSEAMAGGLHQIYVALLALALVGLGQVLLFAGRARVAQTYTDSAIAEDC
jgi:hypothetical protein